MATGLNNYAPYDSGLGSVATEDTWRKMMRHAVSSGVLHNEGNGMSVYADSTGMQVKVRTGEVWIRSQWGENTTEKILPIAAAHATLARIDKVICRNHFVNNVMELDVLTGTPAGSPVAPSITQNTSMWEISLGHVSVPAADTGIDAGQVTDYRTYVADRFQAYKIAQETVTNNTMQDDEHLFVPCASDSRYAVRLHAVYAGPTAGGMKFEFSAPAGASIGGSVIAGGTNAAIQHVFAPGPNMTTTGVQTVTSTDLGLDVLATLTTVNAGTLRFRWAQDATNASPLAVGAGSYLVTEKMP